MNERPEPRWDIDWKAGRQAELWVESVQRAFSDGSIEVKHDMQALRTGNVYVEYECLRRGQWRKSGIATTESDLWAIVMEHGSIMLIISTQALRELAREVVRSDPQAKVEMTRGSHPTRGVLVSFRAILQKKAV